ncbi:LysR family transcriptional regulator [Pseudomonas sp. S75]|uniref:LysR substrate-binding domain-containing protein n=1 Tax=unclassified Pseudomonas TaxID=196821 RepID=UPI001905CC40|nr:MULTISPECIES: LysR substrate-binding domain-containing protein [unclassified Pseudomonas]MBJ9975005.1 LysR family transcriptional regulator [Pseudomonas sp. S30]MBK0152842.1 LysR family transcriptional regulator [Pseudomonas sp. S75]
MHSSERLKGLDVFVAVAECASFTAAAERLNLTASAVSKSVARLEARLGLKLFSRTTRTLALTEAGSTYYRTCTAVLGELEEAETALSIASEAPQGRVRIDLPASFGRLHVLPLILDFVQRFPKVEPHVSFTDRFVDPVTEGIDIVVRIGGPDVWPASLGHRFLGAQRMVFCAAPAYLQRQGEPRTAAELLGHACVVYGQRDGGVGPWYMKGPQPGDMERRSPQARIAVGDGEGEVAAVLAGLGIAQLPTWLTQRHMTQGALTQVLPDLATDGLPINLVWLKRRENLPKVQALLDYLTPRLCAHGIRSPQADERA